MIDKFRKFFTQTKILNEEEFNILANCADLSIKINKKTGNYDVSISLKKILPIEIYKKINNAKNKAKNLFEFEFNGNNVTNFSLEEINPYIYFFIDEDSNTTNSDNFFVKKLNIELNENILVLNISNKSILEELKKIENQLLINLKNVGFKIKSIVFNVNEYKQDANSIARIQMINRINAENIKNLSSNNAISNANIIKTKSIIPLNEIDEYTKNGIIEGQIFKKKVVVTKKNLKIFTFWVTDFENAIKVQAFIYPDAQHSWSKKQKILTADYLESFANGEWVKIDCNFQLDRYSIATEYLGNINKIQKITCPKKFLREDTSESKRIELLAHTKMTAFDGISSAEELVKTSKKYGWDSISIVDRYNVQSYPDAYKFGKKLSQKILYGVELNLLSENNTIAINTRNENLNDATYVIFDIETSGLNNEFCDIIEFGAVKVHGGTIIENIDFFIKPLKPINSFITSKTHITNEMLEKDGIGLVDALKKIKDFCGNHILIAHNGIRFDYRFINKKLIQNKMEILSNPVIDTMQLSRYINESISRHNLGAICRLYKFDYNELIAHRADFDAETLRKVWNVMYSKLQILKINNLNQLNNLSNESFWKNQFSENFIELYCKNNGSFKYLYKLISISLTEHLYNSPRVFYNEILKIRNYFIITNSPYESNLFDIAINGSDKELEEEINFFDYIFVASPNNMRHFINNKELTEEEIRNTIKKIINTANKLNKKVIAVSDSYYIDPSDEIGRRVYINSKLLGGKQHRIYRYDGKNDILPDNHLRTTNEMIDEFKFLKDEKLINDVVINNSKEFSNKIENNLQPIKTGLYPPKIKDVEKKLLQYVKNKIKETYGDNPPELITERLEKELNAITSSGYANIYWISHKLVKKSLEDGYIVGSRGSVGSSFVAFLLNISEVNPLPPHYLCKKCKHIEFIQNINNGLDLPKKICRVCGEIMEGDGNNIPFETFLGFRGEKIPDIDLNFSGEYQAKAHNFIKEMFGAKYAYRAGTIATVAEKTAFGYVKNYFEKIGKPDTSSALIDWVVTKCIDVKRTTGQHPGGIIIVPNDMEIFDFTPYQYPADDKTIDWYSTHFTFDSIHDNLLKFDILGHDDPTKLKLLHEMTGVNPIDIKYDDKGVMSLFNNLDSLKLKPEQIGGETTGAIGIPEFGTNFVRKILIETHPSSIDDLISISGLSHGTDVWSGNAQELINKTNLKLSQVITYRDSIINYLINAGVDKIVAFSIMETVRKGQGIKPSDMQTLKSFKIPEWYINSCLKIKYLFPKAHAAAYVITAWRVAWYKLHYPLEFYASYFTIHHESFDIESAIKGYDFLNDKLADLKTKANNKNGIDIISEKDKKSIPLLEVMLEMFARGYKFENIDLTKSDATKFTINNKKILMPFIAITGLGENIANSIVTARTKKPFTSKSDLINRTSISKTTLKIFEDLGITNNLKDNDQISLFDF